MVLWRGVDAGVWFPERGIFFLLLLAEGVGDVVLGEGINLFLGQTGLELCF